MKIFLIILILILFVCSLYKPHIEIINRKNIILWYTSLNNERKWILLY